jgi:hypothetical protein
MSKHTREAMSIWFFCGVMLLAYGTIICVTGLWEIAHPLPNPPALSQLHAPIWWGALLAISGAIYTIKFRPRR